jgi:hypothetical protein
MGGERQVRAAIRGYLYISGDVPQYFEIPQALYRGMGLIVSLFIYIVL